MTTLSHETRSNVLGYLASEASSASELAALLKSDLAAAEALEIELVSSGLLLRSPGYYANPRFYLADAGLAYRCLTSRKARSPQEVLDAIKASEDGARFAGARLAVYHALMSLVQLGLAQTEDGGGTFSWTS